MKKQKRTNHVLMKIALALDLLGSTGINFFAVHLYEKTGEFAVCAGAVVASRGGAPDGRAEMAAFEYIFPNLSQVLEGVGRVVVYMSGLRVASPGDW